MQWIRRSQKGDHDAFAELFAQYKNLVYKTAYLMLGDAAEAEEAMQDVFVSIYRTLPSFDPAKSAFTTWLYRVTVHHCLNHRRKQQVPTQPLDMLPAALSIDPADANGLAEQDAMQRALTMLNADQQAIVILRFYHDLPYNDIAQILDIPLGTVKSRLDRALKALRELLQEPSSTEAGR